MLALDCLDPGQVRIGPQNKLGSPVDVPRMGHKCPAGFVSAAPGQAALPIDGRRLADDARDVLIEQETIVTQRVGRLAHALGVAGAILVALLE